MNFYVWDLETYSNCFLFNGKFYGRPEIQTFEISSRRTDRDKLLQWLSYLQSAQAHMVGFNSLSFDYPILHELITSPYTFDAAKAHLLGNNIINTQTYGRPQHSIRMGERVIPQIDLVKINHFDNANKRTSLKALQVAMRLESVEDLPFDPTIDLTSEQMDQLISYGIHDVIATEQFLEKCKHLIVMRKDLLDNGILSGDVLNYSDVKLGTEYLVKKIGRSKCFISGSNPRQTLRSSVAFKDIILPKVQYRNEGFNAVLEWFRAQTIYPNQKDRPALEAKLGGLQFNFGMGGVHASVKARAFETNDTHVIRDVDVGSMYPAICIANRFAPEHLGQAFTTAYRQLNDDRKQYPRGTTMNLVLKLANNGASGNFENKFSPLFDLKCAYSMRINGQLQLLQLAEMFSMIPGLEMIQANTDGITALVRRDTLSFFDMWCNEWECLTGLKLEKVDYSKMWIRDVNNYIAIDTKGKIKRKGAYWYPITEDDYHGSSGSNWNKDFSNLSAQKAVEACLINGWSPESVVRLISDPFDFMMRYKTPAGAKLFIGDKEMLKTVRYYVSTQGEPMKKVAYPKGNIGDWKRAPKVTDETWTKVISEIPEGAWDPRIHTKNKSKYEMATTSIESGRLIKECNRASNFNWNDLDYDYYTGEIKKLMIGEAHA